MGAAPASRALLLFTALAASTALGACSLLLSTDGFDVGPAGGDASDEDADEDGASPTADASSADAVVTDAGAGGDADAEPPATFRCGFATRCRLGAEVCCGESVEYASPPVSYACQDASTTCPGENPLRIECTSTSDCAAIGTSSAPVCCVQHTSAGGKVLRSFCVASASLCADAEERHACDPDREPGACEPDASCQKGPFNFEAYFECR